VAEDPKTFGRVVYEPAWSSGAHTLLAAPGLVVLLGGACSQAVIEQVWNEVSSLAPSFERVVQSIPSLGPDAVASFAVAAREADGSPSPVMSIVARGDSFVDVHTTDSPPRRFTSQRLVPWHLASFSGVTGLSLGVASSSDGPDDVLTVSGSELPLVLGVASVASVAWMLDDRRPAVARPSSRHIPERQTDHTDRDERDVTLERAPERRRSRHGGALESFPSSPPRARPFRVRVGSQAPFELHVPVFIGRRPRGPRQLAGDQVILVEVPSPTREVSASHLHIVQRGGEVVVTDLKSTNGTAVTLPGSPRIKLQQGDSIVLPPYSRVEIGDGNVIEILPGAD
jgi:hypothetical protein